MDAEISLRKDGDKLLGDFTYKNGPATISIEGVPVKDNGIKINCGSEPPPSGEVINVEPGTDKITAAIAQAGSRKVTLVLAPGDYADAVQRIPGNVSIEGKGKDTRLHAKSQSYNSSKGDNPALALLQLPDGNPEQRLKSFVIVGDARKLYAGVYVNNGRLTIEDVSVQDCGYTGVWIEVATDMVIKGGQVKNSAFGDPSAARGNMLIKDINGLTIEALEIIDEAGCYGIKSWARGGDGSINVKNLRILRPIINTLAKGTWNNGQAPAFAIEMWANAFEGVVVDGGQFTNGFSICNTKYTPEDAAKVLRVINNRFEGELGYNEFACSNVEFAYNYCKGGSNAFKNTGKQVENWYVHHNCLVDVTGGQYPTAFISSEKGGNMKNVRIEHNTAEQTISAEAALFAVGGNQSGMQVAGLQVKDNVYVSNARSNKLIDLRNGAQAPGIVTQNNFGQNVNGVQISGNPMWKRTDNKPKPYYEPASGSPLIGTGTGGKNIGAY